MAILTDALRAYIGVSAERFPAWDPVERGAVRRYAQAIMDDDPAYVGAAPAARWAGPVAPPLYPVFMFRTPFGAPDSLSERASDPDFDGLVAGTSNGLPELPLHGMALLNGGSQLEFFRYALHGERVYQRSRYADLYERESRNGPMLFVVIETDYETEAGELLVRNRKTLIRR
jgi:hypothetical protein